MRYDHVKYPVREAKAAKRLKRMLAPYGLRVESSPDIDDQDRSIRRWGIMNMIKINDPHFSVIGAGNSIAALRFDRGHPKFNHFYNRDGSRNRKTHQLGYFKREFMSIIDQMTAAGIEQHQIAEAFFFMRYLPSEFKSRFDLQAALHNSNLTMYEKLVICVKKPELFQNLSQYTMYESPLRQELFDIENYNPVRLLNGLP